MKHYHLFLAFNKPICQWLHILKDFQSNCSDVLFLWPTHIHTWSSNTKKTHLYTHCYSLISPLEDMSQSSFKTTTIYWCSSINYVANQFDWSMHNPFSLFLSFHSILEVTSFWGIMSSSSCALSILHISCVFYPIYFLHFCETTFLQTILS